MFHGKNGKTHIQMAIFNSYVKLPEGMFTLANSQHENEREPHQVGLDFPHLEWTYPLVI